MTNTDPLSLIADSITVLRDEVNRRFDAQDRELKEIKEQTQETNGRVTVLERARERGQGMVAAFRWVPALLSALITAGLTILIMAVSGGLH